MLTDWLWGGFFLLHGFESALFGKFALLGKVVFAIRFFRTFLIPQFVLHLVLLLDLFNAFLLVVQFFDRFLWLRLFLVGFLI